MSSRSLPPYDEYESGAPPSYPGESSSTSSHSLIFPEYASACSDLRQTIYTYNFSSVELYRTTFPHYLLAPPINAKPQAENCLMYVDIVLSNKSRGVVGKTPESTVTVHSSTEKTSYAIGGMKITDSDTTDLAIYKKPELETRGITEASHTILTETDVGKAQSYSFEFSSNGGDAKEHFQWVRSRSNEVSRGFRFSRLHQRYPSDKILYSAMFL